jgi:hypothetical protein
MDVRQATPEEEAVMNMELFKTEEVFNARVKEALVKMLAGDYQIQQQVETIAQRRVASFRDALSGNVANAIRSTY